MRIHIVATRLEKDRILPRLANALSEATNWTISEKPDPTADLNYFFPYLELENHPDFKDTPIAAWFSHYEVTTPQKMKLWDDAAKRCDIRITSARMYLDQLKKYGITYLATPPLDRDKFNLLDLE